MTLKFKFLLIAIIFWSFNHNSISQDLKKVKNRLFRGTIEEYYVLKSNLDKKEGPYRLLINKVLCQSGFYKENQRSGVWQIFSSQGQLDFKYNYDNKKLTDLNKRFYINPDDPTSHPPLYLGGDGCLLNSIANNLDIPLGLGNMIVPGRYQAIVVFNIDTLGIPYNFKLLSPCNISQLDSAAVSTVKLVSTSSFPFLPGMSKGKPLVMPMMIPVYFNFGGGNYMHYTPH